MEVIVGAELGLGGRKSIGHGRTMLLSRKVCLLHVCAVFMNEGAPQEAESKKRYCPLIRVKEEMTEYKLLQSTTSKTDDFD